MKNRTREICTSGTVRDEGGNILIYSANDRGDRGNVGIIRSPLRASILPDRSQSHVLATDQLTFCTAGIFHEPLRIEGSLSFLDEVVNTSIFKTGRRNRYQ